MLRLHVHTPSQRDGHICVGFNWSVRCKWETGGATLPHLLRCYQLLRLRLVCSSGWQLPVPDATNLLEFLNIHDANPAIAKLDKALALEITQDSADRLTIGTEAIG